MKTKIITALVSSTLATSALAEKSISVLVDQDFAPIMESLVSAYEAKYPSVDVELEIRPGGSEGDNIVKTRLATGEMNDVFFYNSGSLFRALNPQHFLAEITNDPFVDNILASFQTTVSADGNIYGVPAGTAMGGGILYHIPTYEKLGLDIPMTWDEFMANNAKIKATGITPVAQTYRDTWTSQLIMLADNYNVMAQEPNFPERYTANQAKFATTPAALRSFEKLQEIYEADILNKDFGAASFDDGIRMVSTGEAAHYPMLTFATQTIAKVYPDHLNDVGFFAQPGERADKNGLTVWMPSGIYIPSSSDNIAEAKSFLAFVASTEGCDAQTRAGGATGPYLIKGCKLPNDVPPSVSGMLPYFQEDGRTAPALEFLSPIKGPALEQFTVEVGSGIRSADEAAKLYDRDVKKQARQLGIEGW